MSSPPERLSPPPLKRRRLEKKIVGPSGSGKIDSIRNDNTKIKDRSLVVYSWNVNGISSLLTPDTPQITNFFQSKTYKQAQSSVQDKLFNPPKNLRDFLRDWQWPHIVGLQEVKIAPSDLKTQASLRRTVNPIHSHDGTGDPKISRDPSYDVHFCLPRDRHNATGFGGKVHGVALLVDHQLSNATVKTVDWDLEGRVLICELPENKLTVINVYAVNGTDFDYRDSKTGKVIGTRHDRKRAFHSLLAAEVKDYGNKGWHVIVAGDINISRTHIDSFPQLRTSESHVLNRADFERKFMQDLGMLDTFRRFHGTKQKYSYRPRQKPWGEGGDRVDMILATRGLAEDLLEADVCDTEADRGPSDHVPLFLKVQTWKAGTIDD